MAFFYTSMRANLGVGGWGGEVVYFELKYVLRLHQYSFLRLIMLKPSLKFFTVVIL